MSKLVVGMGIFLFFIGLSLSGLSYKFYKDQKKQLGNAEKVEATIVKSEVEKEVTEDTSARSGRRRRYSTDDTSVSYGPDIRYNYTVDGEEYTSTSVFPGPEQMKSDRKWAQKIVNKYDEGSKVDAYYLPSEKGTSYLVKKSSSGYLIIGIFGLIGMLVGSATAIKGRG